MLTCVSYRPGFVANPDEAFKALWNELEWVRNGLPRREYYCNEVPVPYTYGSANFPKTYDVMPWHETIVAIKAAVEAELGTHFEAVFLNGYENSRDHLGAHADDSPEMDDARPIAIVTLGAERDIWFMPNEDLKKVTAVKLEHGSLCVMAPGMQDTHKHRIPKASFDCGPRISITFRGYVAPSGA